MDGRGLGDIVTEQEETKDTLAREETGSPELEAGEVRESLGLAEPAEAAESVESAEPGEVAAPAESAEPAEAAAAAVTVPAAEPAEPGEVAEPAEPAEPAETAEPAEPAEAIEPAGPEEPLKKRWYVIHTYSGHENKVRANLERAIQYARLQDRFGEILVATEDYAVMKAGKKQITKRKTFPSYVLVEMAMDDESRALVQNIPGVTHFVGDKRPTALTEAEVRRIRGEEVREVGKVTTEVPFKVGESVKVTQGPFADFVGSVDEINLERGKLRVMVSIFGRATAVELDLTHVTSI